MPITIIFIFIVSFGAALAVLVILKLFQLKKAPPEPVSPEGVPASPQAATSSTEPPCDLCGLLHTDEDDEAGDTDGRGGWSCQDAVADKKYALLGMRNVTVQTEKDPADDPVGALFRQADIAMFRGPAYHVGDAGLTYSWYGNKIMVDCATALIAAGCTNERIVAAMRSGTAAMQAAVAAVQPLEPT